MGRPGVKPALQVPIGPKMGRPGFGQQGAAVKKGEWAARAEPGAVFVTHVTPRARRNALTAGDPIKAEVTAPPEDGRANAAVAELLAHALGVAKSRLTLIKGATSRDKVFRLDP